MIESREAFNKWVISSIEKVSSFGDFDFSYDIVHLRVDNYYLSTKIRDFIKNRLNKNQIVYSFQEDKDYHFYFQDSTETKFYYNRAVRELKSDISDKNVSVTSFLSILGNDLDLLMDSNEIVSHVKELLYSFNKNESFRADWSYFDIFNSIIVQSILNQDVTDYLLLKGMPCHLIDYIFFKGKDKVSSNILKHIILENDKHEYVKYLNKEEQKGVLPFII